MREEEKKKPRLTAGRRIYVINCSMNVSASEGNVMQIGFHISGSAMLPSEFDGVLTAIQDICNEFNREAQAYH